MIRLFGYLLMTVGLIGGSLSAITAYRPRLTLPDDQLVGLTLMVDAGKSPDAPNTALVQAKDPETGENRVVTPEMLAVLRAGKTDRIIVKEFAFERWDLRWWAIGSIAVLATGAFVVKSDVRRKIRAAAAAAPDAADAKMPSPERALEAIRTTLDGLRAEMAGIPDAQGRNQRIIDVIGDLNAVQVAAIVDQRGAIMGRLGMGGLAGFMDRFASAERAMNRSWSAAADGYTEEAEECLARAIAVVPEAQARLKGA